MPKSKGNNNSSDQKHVSILDLLGPQEAKAPLLDPPTPPSADYVYPIDAFPPTDKFDISLSVPALVIPAKRTNELRKSLKSIMMQRPRLKVVVEVGVSEDNLPKDDETGTSLKPQQCRKLVLDPQKASPEFPL